MADTSTRTAPPTGPFTFGPDDVTLEPFPHVASSEFLDPELYARLAADFPGDECFDGKPRGGRTGRDFYSGDPGFREFLAGSPAWRAFHDHVCSPRFLAFVLDLFGPHLGAFGCALDPARARFVDHVESREDLATHGSLGNRLKRLFGRGKGAVDDVYARFDVEQGGISYGKAVHCDHPSRLVSLVLYFCDADEIGMEGGDLTLHEHRERKPVRRHERHPRPEDTRVVRTIRPRENTGVLFLCSNNSYHGVSEIRAVDGYRRFVYLNLSSRAPSIW